MKVGQKFRGEEGMVYEYRGTVDRRYVMRSRFFGKVTYEVFTVRGFKIWFVRDLSERKRR